MRVFEKAYAKINLFLDVTAKRCDGFHDIKSIMQTVSLSDDLVITAKRAEKTEIELSLSIGEELKEFANDSAALSSGSDNIICKAARLYLERAGIEAAVGVQLVKRIPIAAGLAGGSADAAGALRALNKIFGAFTKEELLGLSAELGSDVPFCIVGGTALCTGRGEQIVNLSYTPDLNIVISIGKGRIAAGTAYAALDAVFSDFDGTVRSEGERILPSNGEEANLARNALQSAGECVFNIFEHSGMEELSEVEKIKQRLRELGASATLMSGSGPSVFGIFDSQKQAEYAVCELNEAGIFAALAKTVRY